MVQRVIMRPGYIRVSKPGIDVSTAREADLLLSLGARNVQTIQSGTVSKAPDTVTGIESIYNFTVGFPAQASVPDAYVAVISGNSIQTRFVLAPPTYKLTFGLASLAVEVKVPAPGNIDGLAYVIYRKRLDS